MENSTQIPQIDFLLVDSDPERLKATETLLQQSGRNNLKTAVSGKNARAMLYKNKVRFVISALDMPCMNGIELLSLIRRNQRFADTPVLLLADRQNDDAFRYAKEERVDGILVHPITQDSLTAAIDNINLARKRLSPLEKTIGKCRLLFLQREYDQAIELAKSELGQNETDDLFFILSQCYYRQKKYDQALNFLRKILNRPSSKIMHLLSKVCLAENQCGDAIGYLTKANKQNPSNLDLKIDLGKFYLRLEIDSKADEIFEAVLDANPSDLNLIKIGKAYLKRERLPEAGRYLDKTVDPIPETAYIFAQYAQVLEKKGNFEDALKQYEKCLQLVPNNQTYLLGLGKMHMKLNNTVNAKKVIQHILKLDPEHQQAQKILHYLETKENDVSPEK